MSDEDRSMKISFIMPNGTKVPISGDAAFSLTRTHWFLYSQQQIDRRAILGEVLIWLMDGE